MKRSQLLVVSLSAFAILLAPTLGLAADPTRPPHKDIVIEYDGELTRANGIRSGTGTPSNPYVISGWTINNISIRDTTKAITITGNTITGTLRLNFIGSSLKVLGNEIGNLRVNENIPRWGAPTGGYVARNRIGTVSQIRHFDGVFSYNTVGAPETGTLGTTYPETRAVNFDGFNGASFVRNTIYGYMDARLHGHHHSTAWGMGSHMHAMDSHTMMEDHTDRWHEVTIADNRIFTTHEYALAWLDTNHAANDRTAASETNPWLNAPHVHHTRARLLRNVMNGAGIMVDVFNAKDDRHHGTRRGLLEIAGNRVTLDRDPTHPMRALQGIEVARARDLSLMITGNTITGPAPLTGAPQIDELLATGDGIFLNVLDKATVTIRDTRISHRRFGVRALQLTSTVTWTIRNLQTTGVPQRVSYDSTVKNSPS